MEEWEGELLQSLIQKKDYSDTFSVVYWTVILQQLAITLFSSFFFWNLILTGKTWIPQFIILLHVPPVFSSIDALVSETANSERWKTYDRISCNTADCVAQTSLPWMVYRSNDSSLSNGIMFRLYWEFDFVILQATHAKTKNLLNWIISHYQMTANKVNYQTVYSNMTMRCLHF